MKLGYCDKHGFQPFVVTSPRLVHAVLHDDLIMEDEICSFKIIEYDRTFDYFVDVGFLKNFEIALTIEPLILKDRDKILKKMNDRLIIQKIIKEMKWVCQECFKNGLIVLEKVEIYLFHLSF